MYEVDDICMLAMKAIIMTNFLQVVMRILLCCIKFIDITVVIFAQRIVILAHSLVIDKSSILRHLLYFVQV